jgi:hypothetical protein
MSWLRKPIAWAIIALIVIAASVWLYDTWTAKPKAEARLGKNQTGAAIESGGDAVNTVGAAGARETSIDGKVNDAQAKINAAPDASAADAAGRDGLCAVSDDLCSAKRVQQPRSR